MGAQLPTVSLGTGRTAKAVVASGGHTCALLDNGQLKCWGFNVYGQLGLGDANNRGDDANEMGDNLPAVALGTGRSANAIAAGYGTTCAWLDNAQVKCWGYNAQGELGIDDSSNRGDNPNELGDSLPPIALGTGVSPSLIVPGGDSTCVLINNGQVKCWGYNASGQLGLGDTNNRGDNPNEMGDALPSVVLGIGLTTSLVSVGGDHACALVNNGQVKCWGYNALGQLGLGDTNNRGDNPNEMGDQLPGIALGTCCSAKAIFTGSGHTCVQLTNNQIKCWGRNDFGQLGVGDNGNRGDGPNEMGDQLPQVALGNGRYAKALALGAFHACALLDDGEVKCWGSNSSGQLGLGDTTSRGDNPNEMGDILPNVPLW
jgi:alpha-tubulin suppressor-like RCC1 family protein